MSSFSHVWMPVDSTSVMKLSAFHRYWPAQNKRLTSSPIFKPCFDSLQKRHHIVALGEWERLNEIGVATTFLNAIHCWTPAEVKESSDQSVEERISESFVGCCFYPSSPHGWHSVASPSPCETWTLKLTINSFFCFRVWPFPERVKLGESKPQIEGISLGFRRRTPGFIWFRAMLRREHHCCNQVAHFSGWSLPVSVSSD